MDTPSGAIRLTLGDEWIELWENPRAVAPAATPVSNAYFQHFAIVTSDIDATAHRLQRFDAGRISSTGPVALPAGSGGVNAWKFRDPDGHPLELIHFPEGVGDPKWHRVASGASTLGIDHSAISVVDVERSMAFYCGVLGMTCSGRQRNHGIAQDRLDGVVESVVDVIGLRPGRVATPHLELLGYRIPAPRPRNMSLSPDGDRSDRVVLRVDRLDGLLERIQAAGSESVGLPKSNGADAYRIAYIADPDGHRLLLLDETAASL